VQDKLSPTVALRPVVSKARAFAGEDEVRGGLFAAMRYQKILLAHCKTWCYCVVIHRPGFNLRF
jgi:hypothetical protein